MIRAFIALEVEPALIEAAGRLAEKARAGPCSRLRASWVQPSRMHVTMRFLGETDEALVPALGEKVRALSARHPRFTLRATTLGAFPNPRRAHVLVVPLEDDGQSAAIAKELDDELASLGLERETRPYVPHLTLARIREGRDLRDVVEAAHVRAEGAATGLTLYRSELSSSGPTYTALAEAALAVDRDGR